MPTEVICTKCGVDLTNRLNLFELGLHFDLCHERRPVYDGVCRICGKVLSKSENFKKERRTLKNIIHIQIFSYTLGKPLLDISPISVGICSTVINRCKFLTFFPFNFSNFWK